MRDIFVGAENHFRTARNGRCGANSRPGTAELVRRAAAAGVAVPALNVPYLPMMAPIVQALRDKQAFGLIQVARLEWEKFGAGSLWAVRQEYERKCCARYGRDRLSRC